MNTYHITYRRKETSAFTTVYKDYGLISAPNAEAALDKVVYGAWGSKDFTSAQFFRGYLYAELITEPQEPVNELDQMNTKIITQEDALAAIRAHQYIIGSINDKGYVSFAYNPTVQYTEDAARAECKRLAKISPGTAFTFVRLAGAELVPGMSISI